MAGVMLSDYIYNDTFSQAAFFKIPHQLIDDPKFKQLSASAKLLYGLLLDRMNLSAKNGWQDNAGRVYIYYTVKEICEDIGCGRNKAIRLLAELDTMKGIGLIERRKQGQGKPDKIFVKRITEESTEKSSETGQDQTEPISEVDFPDVQKSENPTSRGRKNRRLEVSKANPNKTNKNQTDFIQTNPSIYPQKTPGIRWIDRYELKEKMNVSREQWTIAAPVLCCSMPFRTSYVQSCLPGSNDQDSAAGGAVPASMSFGSTNDPCWGCNPQTPSQIISRHYEKMKSHNETQKEDTTRKRNRHISVWMDESEYQHLKKQADNAGLGIDPFIRNLVAGIELRPRPPETYAALLQELSAIGNNVNQIAYWANAQKSISKADVLQATTLVEEAWRLIKDAI